MSFYSWSSTLERQQGITLSRFASVLMHRLDSESSDSEESSLGSGDSSSDCNKSMYSSNNFSLLDGMCSIDSTLVVEEVTQAMVGILAHDPEMELLVAAAECSAVQMS